MVMNRKEQKQTQGNTLKRRHDTLVEIGKQIVQASETMFIEADGKPGYGSMTAIGAVTPEGATFRREIKPAHTKYDPDMRAFNDSHGFEHGRLLTEGIPVRQVMHELNDWVVTERGNRASVLTAFNVGFDFGWVDYEMADADIENPFGVAGYCLKSLAMSLPLVRSDKSYNWASTKKSNLPELLVPQREFTHDPLDDSLWQQELHFAMVGLLTSS
jgi:DNA polymerase III epsilon subunit-like protein